MKPYALMLLVATLPLTTTAGQAPLPTNYVPCKVHRQSPAVYPMRLISQGITRGEVTLVLEIGPAGAVTDRLVTAYTHEDFATEVTRATKDWTYEPGTYQGNPVISVLTINFEFTVNGVAVYERRIDAFRPEDHYAGRYAYFAHGASSLDRKPVALNAAPPMYPKPWIEAGRAGRVRVRFYIDESGQARLPVAIDPTDDYLAGAAMAAVKEWRFQPPTANGKPVLAYAEQEFVFQPPTSNASPTSGST